MSTREDRAKKVLLTVRRSEYDQLTDARPGGRPPAHPENSALLIIDFQPLQVASVASMDRGELVRNIVSLAKAAKLYGMPIVLSTVNAEDWREPAHHSSAGGGVG